jgi:hypothetical protein
VAAITMGKSATMPLKHVEIKDTDLVTSKVIGIDIYNKTNDDVGRFPTSLSVMGSP